MVHPSKFDFTRLPNFQKVPQMFLLQHSSAICRNFRKLGYHILTSTTDKSETAHQILITNLAHMKEQDDPLIVPVKIRFDETSQFSEGSANISLQHSSAVCRNFQKLGGLVISHFDE